ncbi:MAG: hypothetical protein ACREJC_10760 [Tepidisphaeraceae bacterium]
MAPPDRRNRPHTAIVAAFAVAITAAALAEYPKPSLYPVSWELGFTHGTPRRIVVDVPGETVPQAYWYMTYTVTNKTDREQMFLPVFELLTRDGQVIRSDNKIPAKVFDVIKSRERNQFLEPFTKISGELRIGEDQARDGVAIWPELDSRMGRFSVFVSGLSGEAVVMQDDSGAVMKDKSGEPIILRKTLELKYHIRGDEVYPGEDEVNKTTQVWVMR